MTTGRTRTAGVFGWPITHTRSPQLHGYWLAKYGIDGVYIPFAVAPQNLPAAVRGLSALGLAGANVTVPHKQAVLKLVDEVDSIAARVGAANLLEVGSDGRIWASNTDSFGFIAHLKETVPDWTPGWRPAVVVGAGGAARAVAVALLDAGVEDVRVVNRTPGRAAALCASLSGPLVPIDWEDRIAALAQASLVVNTTTQGMTGNPPLDLPLGMLPDDAIVYDIVYTPLDTPLLQAARGRGLATVDGLGMLLHQARPSFAAWFGIEPKVDEALRRLILADLA